MLKKSFDKVTYLTLIRACWNLAEGDKKRMATAYGLLLVANSIALMQPLLLGKVVDVVTKGGDSVIRDIALWLGAMTLATVAFWCFHGPARVMERRLAFTLRRRLTSRLYGQVTGLPWAWHQTHHSGDTLNRLNYAVEAIYLFADEQFGYLDVAFNMAGSMIMLAWVAPQTALLVAFAIPLLLVIVARFDRLLTLLNHDQNKAEHHLSAGLFDYLGNIATVLTLRLQGASRAEIDRRMAAIVTPRDRIVLLQEQKWFIINLFLQVIVGISLMVYALIHHSSAAGLEAGGFVAVFRYLQQIGGSVGGFGGKYQSLLRYRVNLSGIHEIETAFRHHGAPANESTDHDWQTARVENVSFRYQDKDHYPHSLDAVSLDLTRGKRIALVGASGCGKSTLLRLLRGLHQAEDGSLSLDGRPAALGALGDVSTLVPQDAEIFENSARYNITCGVPGHDDAVAAAVRMACFDTVLESLGNGLETQMNERGVNLSGGQKQRLALARGLFAARDSSLLLFDEPTSALDPATEAEVYDRVFASRTDACIVSSIHRLHLLSRFDQIYVLDQGRIIEHGSLSELLARNGELARLYRKQADDHHDRSRKAA